MSEDEKRIEESRKRRKARKSTLTRECNNLHQLVAEEDCEAVEARIKVLTGRLRDFEASHDEYHELLSEEKDIDDSEAYFEEARGKYIESLKTAKSFLKDSKVTVKAEPVSKESDIYSHVDLLTLINLPKVEIEPYDGDPKSYHRFMTLFKEHVDHTKLDNSAKLSRLLHYTKDAARKAIDSCILMGEGGYDEALAILKQRFGNSILITQRLIQDIKSGSQVKSSKDLQNFSDELSGCYAILKSMDELREIDTQTSIIEILSRLQQYIRNKWKKEVMDIKRSTGKYPGFHKFVDFICRQAEEANDPVYGQMNIGSKASSDVKPKKTSSSYSTGADVAVNSSKQNTHAGGYSGPRSSGDGYQRKPVKDPCVVCGNFHKLFYCDSFKKMSVIARIDIVKKFKLCENCLLGNHTTVQCKKPSVCSVVGCGQKHTKFIHLDDTSASYTQNSTQHKSETVHMNNKTLGEVVVPTVMVNVNSECEAIALLDNASTTTFCTERLVRKLGVQGTMIEYKLNTLSATNEQKRTMIVNLTLSSCDGSRYLKICDVHVVPQIPLNMPNIDLNCYQHLQGIDVGSLGATGEVDLLIGQDHAEALIPLEVKRGKQGEPFAVKTLFGWSLNGPVSVTGTVSNKVMSHFLCSTEIVHDLEKLWEIENDTHCEKLAWSSEDKKVMQLWENNVRLVDGHYELPVPWKPNVSFPDNHVVAHSRLKSLLKNLSRKGLMERYDQEIQKLIKHGYAEVVPELESVSGEKIWYLPHHGVVTEKKPDKLRVVFDCAAKYQGESLNDKAYQGPDLNNKLVNVLLRFRENPIAIMADVEAMYNQVRIPEYDRDTLRFLWPDSTGKMIQYRMTSHLFGGIWCASSSTFALRQVLLDQPVDSLVSRVIQDSFYVDDCLESVCSTIEAETVAFGTKDVLKTAGFNLTKFISNDQHVMKKIPETDRAKEVKEFNSNPQSKALGVCWDVSRDEFYYRITVDVDHDVTKRVMLSIIASMYDPLGLVSPVVMSGRLIFQDVVRLKVGWDEDIGDDHVIEKWRSWIQSLVDHMCRLRFPRCVKPAEFDGAVIELHHFSDASSSAYGSCSYIRCIDSDGKVHMALLMSKGRVAPMKQMTIPRLELQGAVLSAKSDAVLRSELRLNIKQSYFWSDSEIVLAYLRNDSSRFQVFVGNRVSLITSLTDVSQWHHVAGVDNPADLITRVQNPETMDTDKWLYGPKFLRDAEFEWPESETAYDLKSDPEVKKTASVHLVTVTDHPIEMMAKYYSSWYRLKRAVAIWRRPIMRRLSAGDTGDSGNLTVREIQLAETVIVKHVQRLYYGEEVARLLAGQGLLKSSHIRDLDPVLNDDGILCVGGRLKHADLSVECKHPVIIPDKHVIAVLIAKDAHEVAHLGTEWTVSLLRRKYWLIKARVIVKRLKKKCVTCKKLYAAPCEQQMADLPPERLSAGKAPFTYVGCDCFGPFMCKYGRSEVKRYGLLCTCLTVRAVHLEMLDSMSTDSFLNGFRRFVARRGDPEKVFCDNGTNFVGAQSEVDRCKSELDFKRIQSYGVQSNMEWIFNPPHASHMGGVWERMIRSVRRVLAALLGGARLTDDILMTLFAEVESIINSRPLTKMSDDVEDMTPLTPNRLLRLLGGPEPVPGVFSDADQYRRRWRYVQHLANQFWSRWTKEYLPTLQKRIKWQDEKENVKTGDLVLLVQENMPRRVWPLALVVQVNHGRDGLVRSVRVRTRATTLVRPITKVVSLEAG